MKEELIAERVRICLSQLLNMNVVRLIDQKFVDSLQRGAGLIK